MSARPRAVDGVPRDSVRVDLRRRYATVWLDVWPRRLTREGRRRVRAAYAEAFGRCPTCARGSFSYGNAGAFANRIDRDAADELADELRRIAFTPECTEEVSG